MMTEKRTATLETLSAALRDVYTRRSRKPGWSGKTYIQKYRDRNRGYYLCELVKKQAGVRDGTIGYHLRPSDVVVPDLCPVFGTPLRDPVLVRLDSTKDWERGNIRVVSQRAKRLIEQKRALTNPRAIEASANLEVFFSPRAGDETWTAKLRQVMKDSGPRAYLHASHGYEREALQSFLSGATGLDMLPWEVLGDFNVRSRGVFTRLKVVTCADLSKLSLASLLETKNCGVTTVNHIQAILGTYGVALRG